MTKLEHLTPNAAVRGLLPDCLVTVVSVQWFGSEALELTYKTPAGKVANELLYRHDDPRQHTRANFRVEQFRIGDPPPPEGTLPVAALPLREGEVHYVQRGKVRPAVVLSAGGTEIPREIRQGEQRWQSARAMLVAPFYGAEPGGTRGGWPAPFVERIRRAEYPQYVWDKLPLGGETVSILRLDHLFPIGADPATYALQPVRLSDEALALLDEW